LKKEIEPMGWAYIKKPLILTTSPCRFNLQIHVALAPPWHPRQPIFSSHGSASSWTLFRRQNPRRRIKFRPGNLSAYGAGSYFHFRIVPYPFALSRIVVAHHVELAALFTEPHRRKDRHAILAEGCQRNIFLSCNLGRYGHEYIVRDFPRTAIGTEAESLAAIRSSQIYLGLPTSRALRPVRLCLCRRK
jgi:hypothetical protein